ncbi:DEAD/DEAH box helicase [Anoxybacillus sp. LAT_35]|uniref:DEAD/DEAH box helicase n=1 Tax=unclassified Anoxybacillus TaxID=2639704 RepID=UPI0003A84BFE|nr:MULTISPECIES: DEAD/DEAH box helicase [Anoxybacillus]MCG5026485.1 DEAD/DEAH box helicase [Anoxybacillus flavithermus]MCG6196753.1 DEAD/DEAH box helicase [Anoxybacillus sp. LAT_38]MCG3083039.1 DEAD/DEAH box helicase [Anoxybacillus sp. LAT27]MCG6171153.1 DEAD/DEAH box helicase [Anoxybacillus sp. LAT_11]MCG6176229.1 DEAD/DEAH box helicase [Anoxybacillus sp. LAT_31]
MVTFNEFGLSPELMKAVSKMGFEEATPIQAATIPLSLQNRDVIGQAQTGTGKTAAFGIPLIEKIDMNNDAVQAIVVAPTRELAIQVSEELYKIGSTKRVRVLPIYGGQDIERQIRALKKHPHIIVGTPGRILDHIQRRTLRLQHVHTVVLDEADEMLNMGFVEDIEAILSHVPTERQTLLFSATMPEPIRRIAERFMNNPELVRVKAKEMTVPNIEQYYIEIQEKKKFDTLTRLLDIQSPELAIVFGRTKRRVDELAEALNLRGYAAEGIHGDLSQAKRLSVLRKFKEGSIDILVATDVAARGLDISGVTHVYNFDIPQDPESYVHRIGRTGRAGKTGMAITFVTPREIGQLHHIEKTTKRKMERMKPPTLDEALEGQQRAAIEKLLATIEHNNLSFYKRAAEELLEEHDSVSLVAACIKMLTKEPDMTPVQLTEEPPLMKKEKKRQVQTRQRRNETRSRGSKARTKR